MPSSSASPLNRLLVADAPPAYTSQIWRTPRRAKLIAVTVVAIILSLFLFGNDLRTISHRDDPIPYSPPSHNQELQAVDRIVTSTVTVTQHAPAVTETVTVFKESPSHPSEPPKDLEPVVFALLAWSEASGAEATLLIKSILMYITGPVEIHVICDEGGRKAMSDALEIVHSPAYDVVVRFYMPTWEQMVGRIEREGTVFTDHSAGTAGLMKLFLHELVPVDKAIYVDTDAIFISDPRHLWNVFHGLKPETAVVMSSHPDSGTPEWHSADRICSCVMLLDFAKLRKMRLMDSSVYRLDGNGPDAASPPAFRAMFGLPDQEDGRYHTVKLGDQGYWFAIVDHLKELYEPLSFDFEVTSCLFEMYETHLGEAEKDEQAEMLSQGHVGKTPQFGKVIRPKLLHFNCLHGTDKWWEWKGWDDANDKLNKGWGPAARYHAGFKWLWLNRGSIDPTASPKLDMQTADAIFADEQFAKDHGLNL